MKKPSQDSGFQTHIPEPRWQQIGSVVLVIVVIVVWLIVAFKHH